MTMHSNYTDPSTHPRVGTGTQGHDPDYDSPWWCDNVVLPNHARCETCRHWFGVCLGSYTDGRVTRAEDRCMSWRPHPRYAVEVEERRSQWTERDADLHNAEWYRAKRRRLRLERRAGRL